LDLTDYEEQRSGRGLAGLKQSFPHRFGPYLLVAPLGDGGVGDACLALGPDGKPCALKRLSTGEGPRADVNERFRRDGEIARRLSHPAVARTLTFGDVDGELFLTEEYVDGVDLTNVSADEISIPLALYIVSEIARALEHIHGFEGLGLVHRDVAPANVRLSFAGEVKLLDFGLVASRSHAGLTAPGTPLGGLSYLAPEVKKGVRGNVRADVYSAGVILWELLAKRRFAEEKERARSEGRALAPSKFNPAVSWQIDAVIGKATADSPDARYSSAGALVLALEALLARSFDGRSVLRTTLARLYDVRKLLASTAAIVEQGRELFSARPGKVPHEPLDGVDSAAVTTERTYVPGAGRARTAKRSTTLAVLGGALVAAAASLLVMSVRSREPVTPTLPRVGLTAPSRQPISPVPSAEPAPGHVDDLPAAATERPVRVRSRRPAERHDPPSSDPKILPEGDRAPSGSQAVESPPETSPNPAAILREAELRFHSRDLPGAETTARRALELGGGARAQYFLGLVMFAERKFSASAEAFEAALKLDPENREAARHLELARDAARGEK
jgi:serine/threonine-protein kinase